MATNSGYSIKSKKFDGKRKRYDPKFGQAPQALIMPVRKSASKPQKDSYERCVDNVKKQNNKRDTPKLNPWAICNASIFKLLQSQKTKN